MAINTRILMSGDFKLNPMSCNNDWTYSKYIAGTLDVDRMTYADIPTVANPGDLYLTNMNTSGNIYIAYQENPEYGSQFQIIGKIRPGCTNVFSVMSNLDYRAIADIENSTLDYVLFSL